MTAPGIGLACWTKPLFSTSRELPSLPMMGPEPTGPYDVILKGNLVVRRVLRFSASANPRAVFHATSARCSGVVDWASLGWATSSFQMSSTAVQMPVRAILSERGE
eukprot:3196297-Heterocapsa_arctica.AAC.1